jgi:hypothetical protein
VAGNATYATLHRQRMFGSLFCAHAAKAEWTFKRVGFLSPRVTVRRPESDENVAEMRFGWTHAGTLEVAGGRRYAWASLGFWGHTWAFRGVAGSDVTFKPNWNGTRCDVEVPVAARRSPDLALLLALGWYFVILTAEDRAATGGGG